MLHQPNGFPINDNHYIFLGYPVIPWIGLIALGYCLGSLYTRGFDETIRKQWLLSIGIVSVILFFVIRGINVYGDLTPWTVQNTTAKSIMSFFKVSKYPPSLAYLLITIGPSLLFLYVLAQLVSPNSRGI